jgi:hypothetical protein
MPKGRIAPSVRAKVSPPIPSIAELRAFAVGDASHRVDPSGIAMQKDRLGPGGASDVGLADRTDRADDPQAQAARPARSELSDAARRRMDEQPIARIENRDSVQQQMGGEAPRHRA